MGTVVLALALLGSGAAATASTWTTAPLPDGLVKASFYGVSCASDSLCVAVGGNTSIAASTDPGGGAKAWSVVHPGGGIDLPFGGAGTYGGGQIRGVSCPSTGFCVAASFEGSLFSSTNPTGPASAWKQVPLSGEKEPRVHMGGISCPSPSLCVAVAYGGKVVYSTDPGGDRAAWNLVELPQPFDLRGVHCPSVSLCVAVGNEGGILSSTDPTGPASAWRSAGAPAGEASLNGVNCPSTTLCVTGNAGEIITSTDPLAGAWKVVNAGSGLPVKGVSCPAVSACAAVDNNSGVDASTNPTGGQADWWFKTVIPYGDEEGGEGNAMYGISCPSTSLCVAAGQDHQIISSTDPFLRDAAIPARRSKRPRVIITAHPAKRIDPRRGGVRVSFRFHADRRVTRFVCKLTGRPARACKSPMRYRVGRGKRVFRVRAVAAGGVKGPRAAFHFRVGPLEERPPVGSCPRNAPPRGPCVNAR